MTFTILRETPDWLAIDKPPGVSVHNDTQSVIELLHPKYGEVLPVHRLDKETSGVQILALNAKAAKALAEEFQSRSVRKLYTGLTRGLLSESSGVWLTPLTDKAEGRVNPAGLAKDRVPCETRFRTLESSHYFALCEFELVTGRQHQIRKHCALAGHALVGDLRYGDKRHAEKIAALYGTSRMFLHCRELSVQGNVVVAPLPEDFLRLARA